MKLGVRALADLELDLIALHLGTKFLGRVCLPPGPGNYNHCFTRRR